MLLQQSHSTASSKSKQKVNYKRRVKYLDNKNYCKLQTRDFLMTKFRLSNVEHLCYLPKKTFCANKKIILILKIIFDV